MLIQEINALITGNASPDFQIGLDLAKGTMLSTQ
jgi:hypothetical protein